ncbi:hypothetical protein RF11_13558 [Thelohanellus kitauei]|uniref:Uncharacterized protein n=1 Tax=Thelohanellus kitauei TaxID=669202 RepID=A0A0C2MXP1_THEKT|nr:hypothetical protein RF11_13558 [Thelohanellus kitauei]
MKAIIHFLLGFLLLNSLVSFGISIFFKLYPLNFCEGLDKYYIATIVVVVSPFAVLAQIVGFLSMHTESKIPKKAYIILYMLVAVPSIVALSLALVQGIQFEKQIEECATDGFDRTDPVKNKFIFWFQKQVGFLLLKYSCCGWSGSADWKGHVPSSCCAHDQEECSATFTIGCKENISRLLRVLSTFSLYALGCLVTLQPVVIYGLLKDPYESINE